jgi:fumarate reductase flavoprotein subunit
MPVLTIDEARFELSLPVVVAGGGACGLTAALAARDEGCDVAVLERDRTPMGSTSMSLGAACASGTADQARHGIDDNGTIFAADVAARTRGTADAALALCVGNESGPTIDWLDVRHRVALRLDPDWPPAFGHTRARMHVTPGRTGADLMSRLAAACDRAGVAMVTQARMTDVFVHEGRVAGVRYARPDGSSEDVGCDALVLATCGFGGNREMIRRYIPVMADAPYFGWEGNQGDGIRIGAALGGALADMDAYQGLGLLAEPQGIDVNPRFLIDGGFQVNRRGERFSNELDDVSGQGARVMAQPDGLAWVIFDRRIHERCENLPQYRTLRASGGGYSADTLGELATRMGIDADGLIATCAAIVPGVPDRFGRVFTTPPLAAPFHAIRVTGAIFHTQGGLAIDADARVLRADGSQLPNLFAGGGAARGISGSGASGYLPGAGLCTALTLGRIAGRAAARLAT